jgi:hypothetical protein
MKKIAIILCAFFIIMSAFVSRNSAKSGIMGTIDPPEGALKIWAISGTDSISTVTSTGKFIIEVKPGAWKLIIEAAKPYKNYVVENVNVQEGQMTDTGVIKLGKE